MATIVAAVLAAFRTEIDDEVGGLDDVQVVLDDQQRVPGFEQLPERRQQLGDVVEMQPGGRLVEDVEQTLAAVRRQVRRDLDALRLSARQRRRRLAEPQVAEPDLVEHLQAPQHFRRAAEEGQRLADGEVEHLMNRTAAVPDFEHLRLEPLAVALIAGHEDVGEKLHLDADFAFALARFAAAAGHVEREVTGGQPARLARPWWRRTARESDRRP